MKKKFILFWMVLSVGSLVGCAPANITANLRQSDLAGANVQTRCEPVDMRDATEMNDLFAKYDGWRVLYISEYTTANRFGTSGTVCFERARDANSAAPAPQSQSSQDEIAPPGNARSFR